MAEQIRDNLKGMFPTPKASATAKESQIKLSKGQYDDLLDSVVVKSQADEYRYGNTAGTDIADNTDALALDDTAFGRTFLCLLDGAAKTVTLPPNVTSADIGKHILIVQKVSLVASGVLTIATGAGNTFSANSIVRPAASIDQFRPADANDTLTITGANTNSYFGLGSSIFIQVVAAGEYFIDVDGRPLGSSNDAIAFT